MFTQECDHPCNHPTIQPVNLRAAGYLVTISYCVGVFTLGATAKFIDIRPLHCKEDSNYVFLEIKLRGLVPNFHIHTSVSDLYIYSQDRST
jgi:hypothetical protein